ncbi:MAG: AAA family ATPase [Planctomycetes bacterium]|nr:AAA family ATPase [Planctomycetota bacterium]
MSRNIFITATRPNEGKTAITLGLTAAFVKKGKRIGFIKPVGQADLDAGNKRSIDEDTLLIERACRVHCNIEDMNPVTLKPGFPETFSGALARQGLVDRVRKAYDRVAEDKEFVVIEGTGHAAVGSAWGVSNCDMARLLNAKVLLVSSGGVGQPIDDILLNKKYFEAAGVGLVGVVINKVFPHETEKVDKVARKILEENGVQLLGAIPYEKDLYTPTVLQILEDLRGDLLNGESALNTRIGHVMIGAMTPHNAMDKFSGSTLLITPGDREDMILAALSMTLVDQKNRFSLAGLVLTGDLYPRKNILEIIRRTTVPVMVVKSDSYTTASRVQNLVVKISPWDAQKINYIVDLVGKYVNVDEILKRLEVVEGGVGKKVKSGERKGE